MAGFLRAWYGRLRSWCGPRHTMSAGKLRSASVADPRRLIGRVALYGLGLALPCAAAAPTSRPAGAENVRNSSSCPWLPPDAPVANVSFERKAASLWVDPIAKIDLDNPRKVLAHVMKSLPPQLTVLPGENYQYWRFRTGEKFIWGNLRLEPAPRFAGKLHIGYYEFREDLTGPEGANVRYTQLGAEDGVKVERVDNFTYNVTCDGVTVRFGLNRIPQNSPRAFEPPQDEIFVFRTQDESTIRFHLMFNTRTRNFLFVADEDDAPLDHVVSVGEHLALDTGTGFLFYVDTARKGRKILIGTYRRNTQQNNYYDGPADQLSDNFIPDVPRYREYLNAAYPFTRGVIDEYGFYVHDRGNRIAVAPYYTYTNLEEVKGMLDVCGKHEDIGDVMACLIPGGWHTESEKALSADGAASDAGPVASLPALPGLPGVAGLMGATLLGGGGGPAALNGSTVFTEDWEGVGLGQWTTTGLWHVIVEPPNACPPEPAYKSPISSAYYGQDAMCNYDTGLPNHGYLTSPPIHNLPENAWLTFWQRRLSEGSVPVHQAWVAWMDRSRVEISTDDRTWDGLYMSYDESNKWVKAGPISLRQYAGKTIRLRFLFDTGDRHNNGFLGWMVDDIVIGTGAAGGGLPGVPARHMAGISWHLVGQTFLPPPPPPPPPPPLGGPGGKGPGGGGGTPNPGSQHAAGITWHIPAGTFIPAGAQHAAGTTWHIGAQTFIPWGAQHAATVTWHVAAGSFIPKGAKHNAGSTWHVGGQTFIPDNAKHAAGITWHIGGASFVPKDAKHNSGSTWHVGGQTFIPPNVKHASGITWHIGGASFVPKDAKHDSGNTWHVGGVSFIPKDSKHASGSTWHIGGATFVPKDAKHDAGNTWHIGGVSFIPKDSKHASGVTWHIGGATFVPKDAKHDAGNTWHIGGVSFIPKDVKHASGVTWHIGGATFVPKDAKHDAGNTWHITGATFIPKDAKHAAGITWHITGATFIPKDAKHNAGSTWHITGVTFIPEWAKHITGVTWHLAGVTFMPKGAQHYAGLTWHIVNVTFIPEEAKHVAPNTWHILPATFVRANTKHLTGTTWHQNGVTFLELASFSGDPLNLSVECSAGADCVPLPCHQAACNPEDAQCNYTPTPGATCDDGSTYTINDVCNQYGVCAGTPQVNMPCDDANPCTTNDRVMPNGVCQGTNSPAGTPCQSNSRCLAPSGGQCDGQGHCVGPIMVGAPCDDGDVGTLNDTCQPDGGCYGQFTMEGCDDMNECNGEETLDPLDGCLLGDPPNCFDFCAGQFGPGCDPFTGCIAADPPICDIPDDCIEGECSGEGCTLETTNCDDGNPCTVDVCTPAGCVHTPMPDGQTCEDGTACTIGDFCQAGVCTGGPPVTCDPCHACDSTTGQCSVSLCAPPGCHLPFADADGDGDVDQVDYSTWQICFSGADPLEYPDPAICSCFDRDLDSDIDVTDLDSFLNCVSGPTILASPSCGG